jgi:hypothetical protein
VREVMPSRSRGVPVKLILNSVPGVVVAMY